MRHDLQHLCLSSFSADLKVQWRLFVIQTCRLWAIKLFLKSGKPNSKTSWDFNLWPACYRTFNRHQEFSSNHHQVNLNSFRWLSGRSAHCLKQKVAHFRVYRWHQKHAAHDPSLDHKSRFYKDCPFSRHWTFEHAVKPTITREYSSTAHLAETSFSPPVFRSRREE